MTTLRELVDKAEKGHVDTQCRVGEIYYVGKYVPRNFKEAAKWYRMAAEKGSPKGQYKLGTMYLEGKGVECDYGEGIVWVQKAADQNYIPACEVLNMIVMKMKSEIL